MATSLSAYAASIQASPLLNGTLSGTGVILISTLMAAGVMGPALIATDAVISVVLELAKVAVFGGFARLDASLALAAALVGLCTTPGACGFLWRALAGIP